KAILPRPPEPDEYIFPRMGSNGICYSRVETPCDAVQKMLAKVSKEAGLSEKHSSHCLRRGGVKYRIEAPLGERWSLTTIRWWGGRAEGESVDTLIRYLLDGLTRYESHRDALCPIPRQAEQSFNGHHVLTNPITGVESRELKLSLGRKMDDVVEKASAYIARTLSQVSSSSATSSSSQLASSSPILPHPAPLSAVQAVRTPPIAGVCITDLPKGSDGWRVAARQWETPDEGTGSIAFEDWPDDWLAGKMKARQVVAEEFIVR
ncbi:hypothetical protein BV22DRAFT_1041730, partial [Leucogyrophana mollusca]